MRKELQDLTCVVEAEGSRGVGEERGGGAGWLKLADLIRRVGPNEWGSMLEWCSRDQVWVGEPVRGTGVSEVTESHRLGV